MVRVVSFVVCDGKVWEVGGVRRMLKGVTWPSG